MKDRFPDAIQPVVKLVAVIPVVRRHDVRLDLERIATLKIGLYFQGFQLLLGQGIEELFDLMRSRLDFVRKQPVVEPVFP